MFCGLEVLEMLGSGVKDEAGGRVVASARAGEGDEEQEELPGEEGEDHGADGVTEGIARG